MSTTQIATFTITCVLSFLTSCIGASIGLWVGVDKNSPFISTLFWLVPLFALPMWLLRMLWKSMPILVFWAMAGLSLLAIDSMNWKECVAGRCFTKDLFIIAI